MLINVRTNVTTKLHILRTFAYVSSRNYEVSWRKARSDISNFECVRSSVSIVQSNGLQREIRSVRSLEIQEIMVPNIVVVVVMVLLPREG